MGNLGAPITPSAKGAYEQSVEAIARQTLGFMLTQIGWLLELLPASDQQTAAQVQREVLRKAIEAIPK